MVSERKVAKMNMIMKCKTAYHLETEIAIIQKQLFYYMCHTWYYFSVSSSKCLLKAPPV